MYVWVLSGVFWLPIGRGNMTVVVLLFLFVIVMSGNVMKLHMCFYAQTYRGVAKWSEWSVLRGSL